MCSSIIDEAGKLLKELAEKKFLRPGKATEQGELPQNEKSEAANTNGTNERPAIIRANLAKATDSNHTGVFDCNNGSQGGCDIQENEVVAEKSKFAGVFNCGNNESKKPNYNLYFVCLVLLCFAMYKY